MRVFAVAVGDRFQDGPVYEVIAVDLQSKRPVLLRNTVNGHVHWTSPRQIRRAYRKVEG